MGESIRQGERLTLGRRAAQWLDDKPDWKAAFLWSAQWVIGARLAISFVMAATWLTLRPYLLPILQANSIYGKHPLYPSIPGELLLGVWLRWDAVHYINLAIDGYFNNIIGDSVFYPLYFSLIRYLAAPFHADLVLAGLIISLVSAFVAMVFLYRIAANFYGEKTARWAVIVLSIYPTSLFLFGPYTESLYLALTLAAFYYAYQAKWIFTGILGALASLSRGPGIYTPISLLWTAYQQFNPIRQTLQARPYRKWASAFFGLCLPVTAGAGFLAWKEWAGFPPLEVVYRDYTHWVVTNPFNSILQAILICFRGPDFITILEITSLIVFLSLSILMLFNARWRRMEWILYSLLNLVVFLSRESTVASPLQSIARYVLVLFPIFIVVGDWLSRRGTRVQFIYFTISSSILMVFSCLYTIGWFIG